jgi:hypothetical protein
VSLTARLGRSTRELCAALNDRSEPERRVEISNGGADLGVAVDRIELPTSKPRGIPDIACEVARGPM